MCITRDHKWCVRENTGIQMSGNLRLKELDTFQHKEQGSPTLQTLVGLVCHNFLQVCPGDLQPSSGYFWGFCLDSQPLVTEMINKINNIRDFQAETAKTQSTGESPCVCVFVRVCRGLWACAWKGSGSEGNRRRHLHGGAVIQGREHLCKHMVADVP